MPNHIDWIVRVFLPEYMEKFGCPDQAALLRAHQPISDILEAHAVLAVCHERIESLMVNFGHIDSGRLKSGINAAQKYVDGHATYAAALDALSKECWAPWHAARSFRRAKLTKTAALGRQFQDFCHDVGCVMQSVVMLSAHKQGVAA
jgi:hypothetical protein